MTYKTYQDQNSPITYELDIHSKNALALRKTFLAIDTQ